MTRTPVMPRSRAGQALFAPENMSLVQERGIATKLWRIATEMWRSATSFANSLPDAGTGFA